MDTKRVNEIKTHLGKKESRELLKIYKENNRDEYVDEAFEAVRQLLVERKLSIPRQSPFPRPTKPEPIAKAEYVDLVTVYRTGNQAVLTVAKSLLEEAGIRYLAKGEGLQDIIGGGRFGAGFNLVAGPVELQVPRECAAEAGKILSKLQ